MPYVPHDLRTLVSHVPRAFSALVPLVPPVPCALRPLILTHLILTCSTVNHY